MSIDRLSITMLDQLGRAVRDAAAESGTSVSSWLAQAATDKLRNQLLAKAIDAWEQEHGALSEAEIEAASQQLG